MLNKRTIIGISVGSVITALGFFALVTSLGVQTISVNDDFEIGESTTYTLNGPAHTKQRLDINGTSFQVILKSPKGGLQIPGENYKNELSLEWVHLVDGISTVEIQNTGDSKLNVVGSVQVILDPIQLTYHLLVIVSGLVIIGFSAAFSVRKPKGF